MSANLLAMSASLQQPSITLGDLLLPNLERQVLHVPFLFVSVFLFVFLIVFVFVQTNFVKLYIQLTLFSYLHC